MTNENTSVDQPNDVNYWKERCLNVEQRFEEEKNRCSRIEQKIDEEIALRQEQKNRNDGINPLLKLKDELQEVKKGLDDLKTSCDNNYMVLSEEKEVDRQYSRKNSILLHGYENLPRVSKYQFILHTCDELNFLFPDVGIHFNPLLIDDAHPLPTKRQQGRKLVVIKFRNRWVKRLIIDQYAGKRLKKPAIHVSEHLTEYTRGLRDAAAKIAGVSNVYIEETVVHATIGGRSYTIKYVRDLEFLKSVISNADSTYRSREHSASPPLSNTNLTPLGERGTVSQLQITPQPTQPTSSTNYCYEDTYPDLSRMLTVHSSLHPFAPKGAPTRNGRGGKSIVGTRGMLGSTLSPNGNL